MRQTPWPDRAQQIGNCFQNQFEIPVLFYVLVALAILTKKADLVFVVMEWLFVATRIAHAYVFTTSNYVPLRGQFLLLGIIILFLMWAIFAIRILFAVQRYESWFSMTPGARISAAIEVWRDIETRKRPAADALKDWGLSHRFAGSKDRAAIALARLRRAAQTGLLGLYHGRGNAPRDHARRLAAGPRH